MAPYLGPSLAEAVRLLLAGQVPHALGTGLPAAYVRQDPDGWKLVPLSGGAGFGVQADLTEPFVDGAPLGHEATALGLCVVLIKHWDPQRYGDPFRKGETLSVHVRPPEDAVLQFRRTLQREMNLAFDEAKDAAMGAEVICEDLPRVQKLFEIIETTGAQFVGLTVRQQVPGLKRSR